MADRDTPESDAGSEAAGGAQHPEPRPRRPRRVKTEPPAGSDPEPAPESKRHAAGENDERLRGDKPPHY